MDIDTILKLWPLILSVLGVLSGGVAMVRQILADRRSSIEAESKAKKDEADLSELYERMATKSALRIEEIEAARDARIVQLEAKMSGITEINEQLQKQITAINLEKAELQRQIAELRHENAKLGRENTALRSRVTDLEAALRDANVPIPNGGNK